MRPGPRNLITDVAGIRVGNAADIGVKTGTSVIVGDRPFTAAVSVMGGAPGTRETDLLAPDRMVQEVDAIVLSGGSAFGLDAASGVTAGLASSGRGFAVGDVRVPIVPAAILFDLLNGGDKDWADSLYRELGLRALAEADADFAIGSAGAGFGATTLDLRGGLGSASAVTDDGHTVGALVAVNSFGSAVQPCGPHFWAAPFELDSEFGGLGPSEVSRAEWEPALESFEAAANSNTTIAAVATDAALTQSQATRLAVASHAGLARAVFPSHTVFDGDVVFAAATGTSAHQIDERSLMVLGHAAASCLARAIARGVHAASPDPEGPLPSWSQLHSPD